MLRVPFLDVQRINARFQREFEEAFSRVSRSGRYLFGAETEAFEREFAAWNGSAHCISVANGLDALRLTLRAWISLDKLAPGDEIIVPANSFIASALAVTDSDLQVRFADVNAETFNVTVDTVSDVLSQKTRAIMPVHLYGQCADIERIRSLCRAKDLLLLEDAAQAHGARMGSRRVGTFGDAGGFSFYPAKNLGAMGDAGCVSTDDSSLAERVRLLGNYGATRKYVHDFCGSNSRIDEVQAACLRIKLRYLDDDNTRRREIARRYCGEIAHPLVTAPTLPSDPESHVWHLFVIRTSHRASLVRHLEASGVETLIHYPSVIHQQRAYLGRVEDASAPVAEHLQHQVLSLPISPVLEHRQVDHVIDAVNRWPGPDPRSSNGSPRSHGR
jgi:dTDP-4-amino-4,6-dideoxygalactose transaminase